jgi:hypothetical protein
LKIFADLPGEIVVEFVVARDAGGFLGGAIHVDRVVATLTQQLAAVLFDVESGLGASSPDFQRLTNHIGAWCVLMSERPIRFEHKSHRLLQFGSSFL